MNFNFLLTVFLIISLASCKKDNHKHLQKLKSVTGYMTALEGVYTGEKFIADQEVYDEEGYLISSIKPVLYYNEPNYYYPTYYFYKDGRLSQTKTQYDQKSVYQYNDKNLLSELRMYIGDNHDHYTLLEKHVFAYDGQNRKIGMTIYDHRPPNLTKPYPDSTMGYRYTYDYNASNLLAHQYDLSRVRTYEYDSRQNIIQETSYDINSPNNISVNKSYSYQYDKSGKVTELIWIAYPNDRTKFTMSYDNEGRLKTKDIYKFDNGTYFSSSTIDYTYTYFN
jgi:hypothetical protein